MHHFFHVITGYLRGDEKEYPEINQNSIANINGTLAFLMGIANLDKFSSSLIKEGKLKYTPVAIISQVTRHNQKVITTTLEYAYQVATRNLVRETKLNIYDLIYPLFIVEDENIKNKIVSLPDVYHFLLDMI